MSTNAQTLDETELPQVPTAPSPKALLEVMDDPTIIEKVARADYYAYLYRMRVRAATGALTIAQEIEHHREVLKAAKVLREDAQSPLAKVPMIQIVLPYSGQSIDTTIDITPTTIDAPDAATPTTTTIAAPAEVAA